MMKAFLGRLKTELSRVMLVGLSLIFIFPSGNRADVDYSMALLWTSKDASTKVGTLGLLYGDLDVCLQELQRRQTFNTSYYRREYKMNDLTSSYDSVEVIYILSIVIYFNQAKKSIDVGPYFIRQQTSVSYSVPLSIVSNQVTGLSFDWVSKLLYLSDAGYQRILLGDASVDNPKWWRPVIDTNLTSPQDVVVCPNRSYIFWIDLDSSPKIERFDLVYEIREVIVSNDTILRPTKLAIDFDSERLYWLDSDKETIGSCNLDGSDVSLWQLSLFSKISAFTFYRQYLFLGDRNRSLIHAFNASRHPVLSDFQLLDNEQGIIDMATYDPSKQRAIESPCSVLKGGCSHFCIRINATARKCQCAVDYILDSDGISCVTPSDRTTTSRPASSSTQGGASTSTIILASVICGSVVVIAVIIIVVRIIVAKWMKRRKILAMSDGYDNIIPSPYDLPKPDSAQQDDTYTELEDFSSPVYDMITDHASDGSQVESPYSSQIESPDVNQDEELKETADYKRQSTNDDDYI